MDARAHGQVAGTTLKPLSKTERDGAVNNILCTTLYSKKIVGYSKDFLYAIVNFTS
jgi:hypothetical protein